MDTRLIVFTLCVTGLVLVTGQNRRGDGGCGGGGREGGGHGGGGGHGPDGCGAVCAMACEHGNVPDAKGCPTCICNPPPLKCPRNGIWNGIRCIPWLPNTRCGLGASCETTTSGKGICCIYPPPPLKCPRNGIWNGIRCIPWLPNTRCGLGASCETTTSGKGICCIYPRTCPPPSHQAGACVIGPNHCTNDNQCGVNQKCCPEGCGRECKYVGNQYPPIPPNPTF